MSRVPPHNLQAEESLLGAMLLSKDAIAVAVERITDVLAFYKPAHRQVFDAIKGLHEAGEGVDPVTVADELRRIGQLDAIGGPSLLVNLQAGTPATSNAARYCRIICEHYGSRQIIGLAGEMAEAGYSMQPLEKALPAAARDVDALIKTTDFGKALRRPDEVATDYMATLGKRSTGQVKVVYTGLAELDRSTGGMRGHELHLLGARPSEGKTSVAVQIAINAARAGHDVTFATLEMSEESLMDRIIANLSGIKSNRLREVGHFQRTRQEEQALAYAVEEFHDLGIVIHRTSTATVQSIGDAARSAGADLVIVDYVQLMEDDRGRGHENRQQEVAGISRGLVRLSEELESPVLACAQLTRDASGRRPLMSDLKESGQLEQDATGVVLLWNQLSSPPTEMTMIADKVRYGPKVDLNVYFDRDHSRVAPLAFTHRAEPDSLDAEEL